MESKKFVQGSVLFEEGDAGDIAYLVERGCIEISRGQGDTKTVLGEVGAGAMFGEMALISDQKRMATATAKEDTVCVLVPRAAFKAEMNKASAFLRAMLFNMINHVNTLSQRLEKEEGTPPPEVEFFAADQKGAYHRLD